MPKPIFSDPKNQTRSDAVSRLSAELRQEQKQERRFETDNILRILRRRRSKEYIQTVIKLDAGSAHICQDDIEEMLQVIRNEFPETEISNHLCGMMAICKLPGDFDVHTLDVSGERIIHYSPRAFESPLDQARQLCRMPQYSFVEIYHHTLRAISDNGAVATIPAPGAKEAWDRLIAEPTQMLRGSCEAFLS